jgi:large subunit ribosomal protein L31
MKTEGHPNYHEVTIVFPNGEKTQIYSSMEGTELHLDVDFRQLPAWTGQTVKRARETDENISKFNKKFKGLTAIMAGDKKLSD